MSAPVLLNLLNELGKRDKMRGLPSILSLFPNEFNKFNNTGARMIDSIDHMILRLLLNHFFGVKSPIFYHFLRNVMTSIGGVTKSVNTSGLSILLHGVLSLPDATSYDKDI